MAGLKQMTFTMCKFFMGVLAFLHPEEPQQERQALQQDAVRLKMPESRASPRS